MEYAVAGIIDASWPFIWSTRSYGQSVLGGPVSNGLFLILAFFLLILVCTGPIGAFMARVFEGERTFLHPADPAAGATGLSLVRH